eukprot:scaffold3892_cov331-Prasinococcus_capsulatus_cf.AAC.1
MEEAEEEEAAPPALPAVPPPWGLLLATPSVSRLGPTVGGVGAAVEEQAGRGRSTGEHDRTAPAALPPSRPVAGNCAPLCVSAELRRSKPPTKLVAAIAGFLLPLCRYG